MVFWIRFRDRSSRAGFQSGVSPDTRRRYFDGGRRFEPIVAVPAGDEPVAVRFQA